MSIEPSVNHSDESNNFTPLRLLLASLVVLAHFNVLTRPTGVVWPMVYPDFAVEGFYVISGFLIYESFNRNPNRISFFTKRIFRLYPLYLFMIFVQTIVLLSLQTGSVVGHLGEAGTYFAANAVFLNFLKHNIGDGLSEAFDPGINPSLWTLKVEVTFYLLVPLIWLGVQRFRTGWLVVAFFAALVYTTVLRVTGHFSIAKQIPGAMLYFIAGIMICIHRRSIRVSPLVSYVASAVGFAGVTCVQMGIGPFAGEAGRVLFPFLVIPVIYTLAFKLPALHMKRDFSYGVYLIHGPVIQTLFALSLIQFSLGSIALVIAVVLLLALAAERLIERPFIRFGHIVAKTSTIAPAKRPAPSDAASCEKEFQMTNTCLVTGGAGFIGCAISAQLVGMFDTVVAIDNLHPQIHATSTRPAALHPEVRLVVADVTVQETWDQVLQEVQPDVVIHLAAETGTGQSLTQSTRHAMVNAVGTTQMMDALVRHDAVPRTVVLTSSRAVYGEGAWVDPAGATHYPGQRSKAQLERSEWEFPGLSPTPSMAAQTVPHPTSVYGAMKLAQEWLLSSWALSFGVDLKVLRLQNVYGPGQSLTNSYTGIVSLFARLAREGKSIPVYEDGIILRDFVLIDDVADAIIRVIKAPANTPCLDVGSGKATSILDLAKMIAHRYGAPAPHINGMFRNGDVRAASCDVAATEAVLGWTPRFTVEHGTDRLCRWIDEQIGAPAHAS